MLTPKKRKWKANKCSPQFWNNKTKYHHPDFNPIKTTSIHPQKEEQMFAFFYLEIVK